MPCKIYIMGTGSAFFSLNLVKSICVNKRFEGSKVTFMNIDEGMLNAIYGLCAKYAEEMSLNITIEKTMDRRPTMSMWT